MLSDSSTLKNEAEVFLPKSGILMTGYVGEDAEAPFAVTVIVFDKANAGTLQVGNLNSILQTYLTTNLNDLRIVYPDEKRVIHFYKGQIRNGDLLHSDPNDYESLRFQTYDPPIGQWAVEPKQ